jgi:hypothetical protein
MNIEIAVAVVAFALVMLGSVAALFKHRFETGKGIGVRFVQSIAVVILLPGIIILALLKTIDGQAIQVLLGAAAGYVLSGLSNWQGSGANRSAGGDDQ